jgi:hypothetical protein
VTLLFPQIIGHADRRIWIVDPGKAQIVAVFDLLAGGGKEDLPIGEEFGEAITPLRL